MSEEQLVAALSIVELAETRLLRWGIVDAVLTRAEVLEHIRAVPASEGENRPPEAVFDELVRRHLVVAVPDGGYRSRMAETLRLLVTVRQTFPGQRHLEGVPLVLDYRFQHRPRRRPKRDRPGTELSAAVPDSAAPVRAALDALAPQAVSGFQVRAAAEVLAALRDPGPRGVVVAAGTGSGKTNAFYLPLLSWLVGEIATDDSPRVRALALYPRGELLKDQLASVLDMAIRLADAGSGRRAIRVGAWFAPTPARPDWLINGYASGWRAIRRAGEVVGWSCPFLNCPRCPEPRPLVWSTADVRRGFEHLRCPDECGFEIGPDHLALTRQSMSDRPVDILFTTTESLNRQLADPDSFMAFGLGAPSTVRTVLLDEIHTYEGLSGAQNALLMRRLADAAGAPMLWAGLSATLVDAPRFMAEFVNLRHHQIAIVEPTESEHEESGAEYLVALRHHPGTRTGPLSASIQTAMALTRCLDPLVAANPFDHDPQSHGLIGSKTFVFTDKLDVTNRMYWDLLDAEGWWEDQHPKQRRVLTLAHLRSSSQGRLRPEEREPREVRNAAGQWWWLPEALGRELDGDTQLRVARTSSQDVGVNREAEVVVSTASLEVGYDDPDVGAVIQHKAPHDAARFLQRKGRAGRDPRMRPWTAVVLSNWGRDRVVWQLYDQLFSPVLQAKNLPLRNRYVLRMQAVYATLDWMAGQLSGITRYGRSTWADVVAPADMVERTEKAVAHRRQRQEAAARLLESVLEGGPAREGLRLHLRRALAVDAKESDGELDALLWEPPRALLMTVLPTIHRRLRSGWAGERPEPDDRRVRSRTPLGEFVAGNLFDDLMTPDVEITLPARREGDEREQHSLPTVRALRELMPGNVTRHFGVSSFGRRHWIERNGATCDVVEVYGGQYVADVPVPSGQPVPLYRPAAIALDVPPHEVRDASSVAPDWEVHLEQLGDGRPVDLGRSGWSSVITSVDVNTHGTGSGVRVRRFVRQAEGSHVTSNGRTAVSVAFEGDGKPAALGVEFDADGLCVTVIPPDDPPPPTSTERSDRLAALLEDADLGPVVTWTERQNLAEAIVAVLADLEGPIELTFTALDDHDLATRLTAVLGGLVREPEVDETVDLDAPPMHGTGAGDEVSAPDVDEALLAAVRAVAPAAWMERDGDWTRWWRRRLAATVGALWVEASCRARPEIDTSDLAIDIDPRLLDEGAALEVWITELAPGGNGHIELMHQELIEHPTTYTRLLERVLEPTDLELLDGEVRAVLNALDGPDLLPLVDDLAAAWRAGHEAVGASFGAIREMLEVKGIVPSRACWTTVMARILTPGAHPDLAATALELLDAWDRLEHDVGVTLSPNVFGWVMSREARFDETLRIAPGGTRAVRAASLASFFWPRSAEAARIDRSAANPFGLLPDIDPAMLRDVVVSSVPVLEVAVVDNEVFDRLEPVLLEHGRGRVAAPTSQQAALRRLALSAQARPIEVGPLLCYPRVAGVEVDDGRVTVTLVLDEVTA